MTRFLSLGAPLILGAATILPASAAIVQDPAPPLKLDLGHTSRLTAVAFSADGATIVSLDAAREVRWRDAISGATRFIKTLPQPATGARVAADGSLLTMSADDTLRWWEPPTKDAPLVLRRAFTVETPTRAPGSTPQVEADIRLRDFAISPDGTTLMTLMIERRQAPTRPAPAAPAEGVAAEGAAPVAQPVLVAPNAGVIRLWNTDGTLRRALEPIAFDKSEPVVGFASKGKQLVVAFPDHSVRWFDAVSGEQQRMWAPPADAAQKATDSAGERDRRMDSLPERLRDRVPANRTDRLAADLLLPERKFGAPQVFSPDGSKLLSATLLGLKVWDITTGFPQLLDSSVRLGSQNAMFSPDGTLVGVRSGSGLWIWEAGGTPRGRVVLPQGDTTSMAFAPDSKSVALADDRGQVRAWSLAPGSGTEPRTVLAGFFQPWTHITATPDGMLVSTGDATAKIAANTPLRWLPSEPIPTPITKPAYLRQGTTALAVSPDGTLLAEAAYFSSYSANLEDKGVPKGELRVRDIATNIILWREADEGRGSLQDIAWLPDNTLLLGKEGAGRSSHFVPEALGGFQRRDGRTGEAVPIDVQWGNKAGTEQPGGIISVAVAADGSHVLLRVTNGLRLLDLKSKTVKGFQVYLSSWNTGSRTQTGSRYGIYTISPDGSWIAAGGRQGGVTMWDMTREATLQDGNNLRLELAASKTNGPGAEAIIFAPDGTLLAGYSDGSLRAWRAPWTKGAAPLWETAPTGNGIQTLGLDSAGTRIWSSDERGELQEREVASGTLRSTLRLMPAPRTGAPYAWTRWTSEGAVQKSVP